MNRIVVAVSLITGLCVVRPVVGADKPLAIELWPGKVPDDAGDRFSLSLGCESNTLA